LASDNDTDIDPDDPDADGATATGIPAGYDRLAARADELSGTDSPWGESPFQRHHSWPATRELLPPLADARVLVAGCGRGDHFRALRERGADVVGVDASARALATAHRRVPSVVRTDLTAPLPFPDDRFDLVLSHLVLSHIPDWRPVLREWRRVLTPAGRLVVGTVHPEYLRDAAAEATDGPVPAHERADLSLSWPGTELPVHYRPTSAALQAVLDAGFRLERVVEPPPRPAYEPAAPERYASALARPELLCLRGRPAEDG